MNRLGRNDLDPEETSRKVVKFSLKKRRRNRPRHKKTKGRSTPKLSESDGNNADIDKTMTILQLGSASMLRLNVKVNSKNITAVIDTGAEVTIISDKVYESLEAKPPVKKRTVMHGAGRNMTMNTCIIGPVDLEIGAKTYTSDVYVAPMDDDMLLGLDFMRKNRVVLDCCKQQIMINSDIFQMSYGKNTEQHIPKIAKVTVPNKTVLPPNSAVHINGKLQENFSRNYIIEPDGDIPIMMPRCMYSGHTSPRLWFVNVSMRPMKFYWLRDSSQISNF